MVTVNTVLFIFVVFLCWLYFVYRKLNYKKSKVDNAWNQIDVQLKTRFDLVPKFVSILQNDCGCEENMLELVSVARYEYMSASDPKDMVNADEHITNAIKNVLSELYEKGLFDRHQYLSQLKNDLILSEERILFAREIYNQVVKDYNLYLDKLVCRFFGLTFRFHKAVYFREDDDMNSKKT